MKERAILWKLRMNMTKNSISTILAEAISHPCPTPHINWLALVFDLQYFIANAEGTVEKGGADIKKCAFIAQTDVKCRTHY